MRRTRCSRGHTSWTLTCGLIGELTDRRTQTSGGINTHCCVKTHHSSQAHTCTWIHTHTHTHNEETELRKDWTGIQLKDKVKDTKYPKLTVKDREQESKRERVRKEGGKSWQYCKQVKKWKKWKVQSKQMEVKERTRHREREWEWKQSRKRRY